MKEYLPTEKEVESGIVTLLQTLGFAVYKNSQPRMPMVTSGIPDLMIFGPEHKPCFFFLEVKTERRGSKLRDAQLVFQKECEQADVDYKVWRSSDKDCWEWLVSQGYVEEV